MLPSVKSNKLTFDSNNIKHLKYADRTSMNNLQTSNDPMTTPIRFNQKKFFTPGSIPRRCALGIVNKNSNELRYGSSSDESLELYTFKEFNNQPDESVILQASSSNMTNSHLEDDLPHKSSNIHCYEDTFDDLMPNDERIERLVTNQANGVNIFAFHCGMENRIRCQSPQSFHIDVSNLLDILD